MNGLLRQLVILMSLVSCSDESIRADGPTTPSPVLVHTQPADLTSNSGGAAVRIVLQPWIHGYVTTALIQEVRAMISAEAEGHELSLVVELERDNAADSLDPEADASLATSFLVHPREGVWPDSWVELRIGPLTQALNPIYLRKVGDYAVTRFSAASRPVIRGIEICPKADDALRLLVHFSELVGGDLVEGHLIVSQHGATCELLGQEVETQSLTFHCRGFALDRDFTFAMISGIRATSGLAIETYEGADSIETSLVYNDLDSTQEGCRAREF